MLIVLQLAGQFNELARTYRQTETDAISIERIAEYTNIEPEAIWERQTLGLLPVKPLNASVEFRDVSLRYRDSEPPVIRSLSFRVESGERVAIVGRTGAGRSEQREHEIAESNPSAGKTSITQLLYRLIEPFEGEIRVGETPIRELGRSLRRLLTIIPQVCKPSKQTFESAIFAF